MVIHRGICKETAGEDFPSDPAPRVEDGEKFVEALGSIEQDVTLGNSVCDADKRWKIHAGRGRKGLRLE
jgi:hypothetical protein